MSLLAVDLGLRAGFALYGRDAALRWYRSQNFGSPARLKRAAWGTLSAIDDLQWVVLEGDRNLAEPWMQAAERRGAQSMLVSAETWRPALLLARQQRSGRDAKRFADSLAREVIERSGGARPTSLRHDAAEAILIGWWGLAQVGWRAGD